MFLAVSLVRRMERTLNMKLRTTHEYYLYAKFDFDPAIWVVCKFALSLLDTRTNRIDGLSRTDFDDLYVMWRLSSKGCAFGVSMICLTIYGLDLQKPKRYTNVYF